MTLEPTQFATEAELWNAILRQFGQPLALPGGSVTLSEASAALDEAAVHFRIGFGRELGFSLALQDYPFARLTGVEITLAEIRTLPPALAEGLFLAAVQELQRALPPTLADRLVLPASVAPVIAADCWLAFELDLGSGAVARGQIGGRRQDFVQVLSQLFPGSSAPSGRMPPGLLDGLSVEVEIAAGEMTLPLATARELEPGDVLLASIDAEMRSFQLGGRTVRIGMSPMNDNAVAPAPGWSVKEMQMTGDTPDTETSAASLDEVPLTLRFVTEDRRIALSDLQGLTQGSLLPIEVTDLTAGLPVRIQANGMTIGEGHLIRIDDRFAVRVARLSTKAS